MMKNNKLYKLLKSNTGAESLLRVCPDLPENNQGLFHASNFLFTIISLHHEE